jgi:hypothetical protein
VAHSPTPATKSRRAGTRPTFSPRQRGGNAIHRTRGFRQHLSKSSNSTNEGYDDASHGEHDNAVERRYLAPSV